MIANLKAVPSGYIQTEVGIIPDDWDVRHLRSLVAYSNGKAHEGHISDIGKYIVVNSKFISTNGEVRKYSNSCFSGASKGEILMVMSDIPNGRAIARCFYVGEDDLYAVNQRICSLRPCDVDGRFLFYRLDRNPYYLSFDDGVKQTNLRKDDVLSCPIAVPPTLAEQEAIAEALGDADALIESLDGLVAKKRHLKQAAMQQLLTGKTRLPGFECDWKNTTLGNIANVSKGSGLSKSVVREDGRRKCVLYGELFTKYGTRIVHVVSRTDSHDGCPSHAGDILMPGSTTTTGVDLAKASALQEDDVAIGGDVNIIRPRSTREVCSAFLADYFTEVKKAEIAERTQGITIIHLYGRDLLDLRLQLPAFAEQQAIAAVFSDMDTEIEAIEAKLAKARQIKQGMMQELLTGRTRLIRAARHQARRHHSPPTTSTKQGTACYSVQRAETA